MIQFLNDSLPIYNTDILDNHHVGFYNVESDERDGAWHHSSPVNKVVGAINGIYDPGGVVCEGTLFSRCHGLLANETEHARTH